MQNNMKNVQFSGSNIREILYNSAFDSSVEKMALQESFKVLGKRVVATMMSRYPVPAYSPVSLPPTQDCKTVVVSLH